MIAILLRPLALLCLAGSGAGCPGPTETHPPVDGEFASVTVYGRVLGPDGTPVQLVEVEARRAHSCGQTSAHRTFANRTSVTTGTDGRFRSIVGEWGTRHEVCLIVRAAPRETTGLAPDSLVRTPVLMLSPPGDSVEVDVHLRAK